MGVLKQHMCQKWLLVETPFVILPDISLPLINTILVVKGFSILASLTFQPLFAFFFFFLILCYIFIKYQVPERSRAGTIKTRTLTYHQHIHI